MTRNGLKKIRESTELTQGEKDYILDFQFGYGGDFMRSLWQAIGMADRTNLARLRLGFPEEVDAYVAWTNGDLYQRASRIAGGDVRYIEEAKE